MSQIKQSFCWWCFDKAGLTPQQLLRAAADIGYQGVELVGPEHWPLIKEHGLRIVSTNGGLSIGQGLNRREHHEQLEQRMRAAIEQAEQWNIPNVIVFSGNREGLDDRLGAEITAEGLRRVAGAAEEAGVTLVMELLNSKVNHKDYQCDHTAWGVEVCRMVNSPRVKLLYDIYHMQIMEGDLIETIRKNIRWIGHFHTGGVPGRHELDGTQEVQWDGVMRAIADSGFKGYVAHEFVPIGDPIGSLRKAVELCDV